MRLLKNTLMICSQQHLSSSQGPNAQSVTSPNLIKHGRGCIGNFLLSSIFWAAFGPINQLLPSHRNTQSKGDAEENRCHLFNKLIFIQKKNVCGIPEEMKSMWGFVNIQLYDPEVQIKFSWTRQSGMRRRSARKPAWLRESVLNDPAHALWPLAYTYLLMFSLYVHFREDKSSDHWKKIRLCWCVLLSSGLDSRCFSCFCELASITWPR